MKSFYTIIPISEAISLVKDPGIIPQEFQHYGYHTHYVSFLKSTDIPPEIRKSIGNLDVISLVDDRGNNPLSWHSRSVITYIWHNAHKIDILNLYFLKHSILYALIYKLRNRRGEIYLKLDMNVDDFEKRESDKIEIIRRWVYRRYLNTIPNWVSAETTHAVKYVQSHYCISYPKLLYVPNGIDDRMIEQSDISILPYEKKENIMLTVGRLGTPQKNTELMLDAISKVEWCNGWKFILVGPIADSFMSIIDDFYEKHPDLREKVMFMGECVDRLKLFDWYNRAKVFCLSSRWESFGIVLAEAQYFGNYILSTPLPSSQDFIEKDNRLGKIILSSDDLAYEMQAIINNQEIISDSYVYRTEHGKRFTWSRICGQLKAEIEKIH